MTTKTIKSKLEQNKIPLITKYHIKEIGLFGSFVRNEQTSKSDVDILVDFVKPIGWDVVDLKNELQKLLGVKVDLVLKQGIIRNKKLWKTVKQEVVYV